MYVCVCIYNFVKGRKK